MPLSEHEQRMLEQMERALYAEDPKFATALEGSELRTYSRKRAYQSGAGFLVGVGILMGGMVAQQPWLGVVGFLVMLSSAILALTGWRKTPVASDAEANDATGNGGTQEQKQPQQPKQRRSMMNRMEQRWQRRRDDQDG